MISELELLVSMTRSEVVVSAGGAGAFLRRAAFVHGVREDAAAVSRVMRDLDYGSAALVADAPEGSREFALLAAAAATDDYVYAQVGEWVSMLFPGWPPVAPSRSFFAVKTIPESRPDRMYATHSEYLRAVVEETAGPVLELGCGHGSTPLLHDLCADRLLVTVDHDGTWVDRFKHMASERHLFSLVDDPCETEWLDRKFDVVFVDHDSKHESKGTRDRAVRRARATARYVVAHDTHDRNIYPDGNLSAFKYRLDFKKYKPWTTVSSDEPPRERLTRMR